MNRRSFLTYVGLSWLASASPMALGTLIAREQSILLSQSQSINPNRITFYVAPNGNDAWSGKQATATGRNGPFATIERARNEIRKLKSQQGGTSEQPATVFLRGGTYFLHEPLLFTSEDSGTANYPITYAAYQNEKPIVSGGRLITGWKPVTLNGKQLWAANIPEVEKGEWFFRQLWVNGERRNRSRYPKTGYLPVEQVPDATPDMSWQQGQTRFKFREGDLKAWKTLNQAEAVILNYWVESRLPIESIDESQRLITLGSRILFRLEPANASSSGAAIYYIEHVLEVLDAPGEWYLDRSSGTLYYIPMPGEDMTKAEIIAPVLSRLVDLQANWKSEQFVEQVSFENITFAHSDWYYPPNANMNDFGQAAIGVPGAIYGNGVRNCTWQGCTIAHISNYGIEFSTICYANQVIDCQIFDTGAGGVKISSNGGNKIFNCHIYNGGRIFHSAVGIAIAFSSENHITRNHIHDFYYSGISLGWTWGYGESWTRGNIIELNHIHQIGLLSDGDGPLLNDKGGIYTLGVQPGAIIRGNTIHDINAFNYGGWGIYLDEGSSQILIENNLVYRTRDGGFHLHYGRENIIRNNIFAFGKIAQIQRSASEQHLSLTFEGNIIYWREGKLLEGIWDNFQFAFDRNLYWRVDGGEFQFSNLSWEEWRNQGMDEHSVIADPLFVNPDEGNFKIKPNSPTVQIGFVPFLT